MLKKPFYLYILILVSLIVSGAILLLIPGVCLLSGFTFIDAIFTAASAVTLTGLELVKTGTSFSLAGQAIILFLIQSGGLLVVISTLYFAYLSGVKLSIIPDQANIISSNKALKKIIYRVLTIMALVEIPAIVAVFSLWGKRLVIDNLGIKLFHSAFLAISAFCNSGFTLLNGNFTNPSINDLYILHLALAVIMFLGLIGFPAIYDLISIKNLRQRMLQPSINWELNTRIAFYGLAILILSFSVFFYLAERHNLLAEQKTVEAGISTIFHAISLINSGFSTFQINAFSPVILWLIMLFMLIGGNVASTSGGIKISTVYFLFSNRNKTINDKAINPFRKDLSKLLLFSLLLILIVVFVLFFTERNLKFFEMLFETVSAFSASGPGFGISSLLLASGKLLLILMMLAGRIFFPGIFFLLLMRKKQT